jgi:hypothetical protein
MTTRRAWTRRSRYSVSTRTVLFLFVLCFAKIRMTTRRAWTQRSQFCLCVVFLRAFDPSCYTFFNAKDRRHEGKTKDRRLVLLRASVHISLDTVPAWRDGRVAEGARLESVYRAEVLSRVRIPLSPFQSIPSNSELYL